MLALERTIVELAPKLGVEQLGRPLQRLPPMYTLFDQFVAGFTFEYNLLSSVSHGRESLIIELMLDGNVDRLWASKHSIDSYHMWSLINNTINWISKATWVYFDYCGWNFEYMTRFLEKYYESVGLAEESRFVPPHVSPITGVVKSTLDLVTSLIFRSMLLEPETTLSIQPNMTSGLSDR